MAPVFVEADLPDRERVELLLVINLTNSSWPRYRQCSTLTAD